VEVARLFVAADLPGEVRLALAAPAALAVPGRRVPAESLHITLCFLGEVDEAQIPAISSALDSLRRSASITLAVGEVLWLPPRRPRVCAVALIDSSGTLGALQASLSSVLDEGGWYVPERRPFLAHVTVARLGREQPRQPPAVGAPGGLEPFAVPSVSLYRSWPGSRYEALASVALPAPGR
jgi:RNA 2',3'-cyclic 3'-phosphodiesterase